MPLPTSTDANSSGDLLWSISAPAKDGSSFISAAEIRCYVDGTVKTAIVPSRVEIWTSSSAGTLTKAFTINSGQLMLRRFAAPAAKTTSTTLTAAEVLGGMITVNQGAAGVSTLTLPLGTDLSAAFATTPTVGDCFEMTVTNLSTVAAEDCVIAGNTGTTLKGNGDVASNAAATDKSAGTFRFRNTGAGTWDIFRIA